MEEGGRLRGEGIRSSLLIGKEEEGKTFQKLHAFGINDDLWDRLHGLGSET